MTTATSHIVLFQLHNKSIIIFLREFFIKKFYFKFLREMSPVCRLGHLWVHGHRPQEGHLGVLRQGPPAAGGEEGRAL